MVYRTKCRRFFLLAAFLLILLPASSAFCCTLWGAVGARVEGGGALAVKNRDWHGSDDQKTRLFTPAKGWQYFALIEVSDKEGRHKERITGGVNEKGLVVLNSSAGSIPRQQRLAMRHNPALMKELLSGCASVDEALRKSASFAGPRNLLLADRRKIAILEIAGDGKYAVEVKKNSYLFHTNHFVLPGMLVWNKIQPKSSLARYQRIGELLAQDNGIYTMEKFLAFSRDQAAGPDDSIFRTGSKPGSIRTEAVFAVYLKPDGDMDIYVRLLTAGKPESEAYYRGADLFAKK